MEIKVKARVIKQFEDYKDNYFIKYTYKVKGFKKDTEYISLIWKRQNESHMDYDRRIIAELGLLTKEEVIDKVKNSIVKNLSYRILNHTAEQEKKRLLKELNNIKFNFKVKKTL